MVPAQTRHHGTHIYATKDDDVFPGEHKSYPIRPVPRRVVTLSEDESLYQRAAKAISMSRDLVNDCSHKINMQALTSPLHHHQKTWQNFLSMKMNVNNTSRVEKDDGFRSFTTAVRIVFTNMTSI